jgi:hypothetical protein
VKQDSTQESGKTALNLDVPESGQPTQAGSENQGNNKAKGRKPIKTIYLIELGDDQTKQVIETTAEKLNEAIGRVHGGFVIVFNMSKLLSATEVAVLPSQE